MQEYIFMLRIALEWR